MTGIVKRFGATHALRGVDLEVRPGEVMALVGENGAGKSTLVKVLSGAHDADAGTLQLDGAAYRPSGPLDARERGIAMIYQELSLAPHLSVMENVLLGIEPVRHGLLDRARMRERTREALAAVGLDVPPDTLVRHLPIGRQQLVEIARAVASECRVLVLDEPTSSLSREDIERLFALIGRLTGQGIAVVYISHFLEEVQEISDRFTVLRDGETVGTGVTGAVPVPEIIAMMVGREVEELYPRSPRTPGETLLEVEGLAGPGKPVSATLEVRRGEVLGVAGLVGSGRTELLRTIFGLDTVRSGRVRVTGGGRDPRGPRWRQGVGMVSEDRKTEGLALGLSIADNTTLARLDGLGPGRLVLPSRQRRACAPWIKRIPIKCRSAAQRVGDLSGGNQQKVALARLLHADVDVLLLDEPTRGIDVGSKAEVYALIDELARGDKGVLLVSGYLPELLGVCDRIAVMYRGRLGTARKVEEWNERRLMAAATGQD